jgi:predicted nucleotidyltransferase component of viral defense system
MITYQELKNLVTEWGLRDDVIEKDYVIGWLLWGIGSDPNLGSYWAFKGGTSLKKCYIETWRFSEDIDFTVLPGGPDKPGTIEPMVQRVLEKVHNESGIDFSLKAPVFKYSEKYLYTEGSVYYRGPRNAPLARVKLDISGSEKVVRPTVLRKIYHPYSGSLPKPDHIRCYSFEEVFAEKLRAMGERGRPRDLYDIVHLFRRRDLQAEPRLIAEVLKDKCETKGVPIPTLKSIQNAGTKRELMSEWENMLGHQLPVLPPFEQFWDELPNIFNWLAGVVKPQKLASISTGQGENLTWTPPPTIAQWGLGIPLESIRFAAINHLCVKIEYLKEGHRLTTYLLEPYSLRKTQDDNIILHAIKHDSSDHRTFRIDWIKRVEVTKKTFKPSYEIEFSPTGAIHAPETSRKSDVGSFGDIATPFKPSTRPKTSSYFGIKYVFQCGLCQKKFTRSEYNLKLNAHKNSYGMNCSGRTGFFVGNK